MKLIIEYPFSDAERATLMGLLTGNTREQLVSVPQQPTGTLMVDGVPALEAIRSIQTPEQMTNAVNTHIESFVPHLSGSYTPETGHLTGFNPFVPVADTLPVPPPPMSTIPTPPAGVTVDSEGLPWDKRIHASTKTRRQSDDTWKLMKNVSDALVRQVKAELRQAMSAGVTAPVAPTPPVPTPAQAGYRDQSGGYTPQPTGMSVLQLIEWIHQKTTTKELTDTQVSNYLHNSHGIDSLSAVPPELVAEIHKFLSSICIPFTAGPAVVTPPPAPVVPTPPAPVAVDPFPFGAPATGVYTMTYADICEWMVSQVAGGTMTKQQVQDTFVAHGLPTVPSLEHRPDLIPVIYQALVAVQS